MLYSPLPISVWKLWNINEEEKLPSLLIRFIFPVIQACLWPGETVNQMFMIESWLTMYLPRNVYGEECSRRRQGAQLSTKVFSHVLEGSIHWCNHIRNLLFQISQFNLINSFTVVFFVENAFHYANRTILDISGILQLPSLSVPTR